MTDLTFVREGRAHIAEEGDFRFVLHALSPDTAINRWVATVYRKGGKRMRAPTAQQAWPTKAAALRWFEEYRGKN